MLALFASVLALGFVGTAIVARSGIERSGEGRVPQAVLWVAAYLAAYVVVYGRGLPGPVEARDS